MATPDRAPTLRTERLELVPIGPADQSPLLGLLNLEDVRRYLLDGDPVDAEWVASVIETSQGDFEEKGLGLWGIREPRAADLLGITGFMSVYDPPVEELIYAVHPDVFGRGIAGEAASAAIDHAFGPAGRREVRASTDAPNEASLALMQRLGFEESHREPASEAQGTCWEQVHAVLDLRGWQARKNSG
ncbi:MAG: GNAT family N-acetyltransferase [Myxococcota bacterium]|nr:GNAT family N-acetyltransferase [Myxococcota bacterium]